MKPSTYQCLSEQKLSSANSGDVQTGTVPKGTSAIELSVESSPMRITYSPTGDPSTGVGLVYQHAQNPVIRLIGQGAVIRCSAQSAASQVQISYLS